VTLAFGGRVPRVGRVVVAALLFALLELAFAASRSFPLSMALLALAGFAMIMFTATANTICQTNTPQELRGRVMSIYVLLFAGTTPLGSLFVGVLAHAYGAPAAMAAGGALSGLAAVYGLIAWWRHQADISPRAPKHTASVPVG
jgi:MFS family permease